MKKGFTLIELLIVIGIVAILATAVVVILNPAQLLAQARDATRISDLNSVKAAIALYLSSATTPTLTAGPFSQFGTGCYSLGTCTTVTSTAVTGTGWVGINLGDTSGGSPLAALPTDPTNDATYHYAYKGDNTNKTFELNGALESTKYSGMMLNAKDGGPTDTAYEVGTDPGLDL